MLNINGPEILVIAVIFLLLFGPERVPEMAIRMGRLVYQLRQAAEQATSEFTRELELAAGDLESVKNDFEAVSDLAKKTLGADLGTISSSLLKPTPTAPASSSDPASAANAPGDSPPAPWRPPTAEELAADDAEPVGAGSADAGSAGSETLDSDSATAVADDAAPDVARSASLDVQS